MNINYCAFIVITKFAKINCAQKFPVLPYNWGTVIVIKE